MGDVFETEELIAEEDEVGFSQRIIAAGLGFISAYGWYILAASIGLYFLWKNYGHHYLNARGPQPAQPSAREVADFQKKEEARQKRVAMLQEQYEKEATVRAEKLRLKEEEKRQERLAELEKLTGGAKNGGQKLGDGRSNNKPGTSKSTSKSLRPGQ